MSDQESPTAGPSCKGGEVERKGENRSRSNSPETPSTSFDESPGASEWRKVERNGEKRARSTSGTPSTSLKESPGALEWRKVERKTKRARSTSPEIHSTSFKRQRTEDDPPQRPVKCLQDLPPEIEEMIMGYLSPPEVMAFGATCSRYHEQTQNRWVWKSVCSHMQGSQTSEGQRSAILKYTQALHYQKLGTKLCSRTSTSKARDVPEAYGYQRVVPVRHHVLLWDYQGTLHLLKHDNADPGSLFQPTILCHNVMDFAVDPGSDAYLRDYVYILCRPEHGPQDGPQGGHQNGPRGTNYMHVFHLGSEPEYILRAHNNSMAYTQISLSSSGLSRKVLLLSDTGLVARFSIREFMLHITRILYYEVVTPNVFGIQDPLPIRQVYSSQKSALYLCGDGTVHLEVYYTYLLMEMFGRQENRPPLRTPVLLPLPTKVVKCSVGPAHLCLVDERGGIFTQGCNLHGQLGTGNRVNRTQLTEMAVSMMPIDVWCGEKHTLVLLKDESGHKELHGCGSGARGRLPGCRKGSNVLVKLNVRVPWAAHSICVVEDCLYIVSSHDITKPELTYN